MGIAHYLREIGRGSQGARALDRAQAGDLLGKILDGAVSDLELGAFCMAMRIKGETAQEMAGFLDAVHGRIQLVNASSVPTVVLPSYNGARKQALLTPLLALLLAREGLAVLVHSAASEPKRLQTPPLMLALGIACTSNTQALQPGECRLLPTAALHPMLARLVAVRQVVGVRNSAHSLVKLLQPVAGRCLLVSSYTHPEYAQSMAATLTLMQRSALLLRGTEGEPVADARRTPRMLGLVRGQVVLDQAHQDGALQELPMLPDGDDASATVAYTRAVLEGRTPIPAPIGQQLAHILQLATLL